MDQKIGLQLYSLKEIMNKDNFVEILQKIKAYGYEGVEGVERDNDPDTVHLFCGKPASEVKKIVSDIGLEIVSNHVGLKDLKANFESIVEYHKELGCTSLIIANIPNVFFQDRATVKNAIGDLIEVGEKLKGFGFSLALHNCPFTFVSPESYQLFDNELVSSLSLQPDAGNAMLAGVDPVEYFGRLDNRFVSLHVKDAKPADPKDLPLNSGEPGKENDTIFEKFSRYSTPVGKGATDLRAFLQLGVEKGVEWFVIEEEMTETPLQTVKEAIEYIKGL